MGIITYIGMIVNLVAIFLGAVLLGGSIGNLIDIPSVLLTVIPTFGALASAFPTGLLANIPAHLKVVMRTPEKPEEYIQQLVTMAKQVRMEGLLSLENYTGEDTDPFLDYGLHMIVDGADEDYVKNALQGYLVALDARHAEAASVYDKGSNFAPAFGMCATVVSLINMLMSLDFSDPNAINALGGNMSAALVTTLYGSMLANIFFLPVSTKLKSLHKNELFCKTLIADGLLGIRHGDNPTMLEDMLLKQLSPKARAAAAAEKGGDDVG